MAVIGGGSFSGRALYDTGAFDGVAEDVSDLISMISPFETPLLAALGDAQFPARNVYHEWLEDSLGPNTIVSSTAMVVGDGGVSIAGGQARFLQVGMVLRAPEGSGTAGTNTPEYMQITAIAANTVSFVRAFGGTVASTYAAGTSFSVVSDSALEGSDVVGDVSKSRIRKGNYAQIFKRDVIISGTMRAVTQLGGITDEWDYQKQQRLRECLRDLEKATILSRLSGSTLGSASTTTGFRTMAGLLQQLTTNVDSWGTLTDSALTSSFKKAWDQGGTDIDLILAGDAVKRQIDQFNSTRVQAVQGTGAEGVFRNLVSVFECTYGVAPIMLNRWMPANRYAIISTARIKLLPLQGRSFSFVEVSKTGDSNKGMCLGEYTLEIRNEEGMVQGKSN